MFGGLGGNVYLCGDNSVFIILDAEVLNVC